MFKDFFLLCFPHVCLYCKQVISKTQPILCIGCTNDLPITQYYLHSTDNFLIHNFLHPKLTHAASFYFFSKKSIVFRIIENLKYKNTPSIGWHLGEKFGWILKENANWIKYFDCIIPVPLHPKKLKKRGYNQSDVFAQGLSITLQMPWQNNVLIRKIDTQTQTKRGRSARFENMKQVFGIIEPKNIQGKNVILVDDVVTTGATLAGCMDILSPWVNEIAILTIAVAE